MNKPGYKTTEFWLASVASIITILNESGVLGGFLLPTEAIMSIAGIVVAYITARTVIKIKSTEG